MKCTGIIMANNGKLKIVLTVIFVINMINVIY